MWLVNERVNGCMRFFYSKIAVRKVFVSSLGVGRRMVKIGRTVPVRASNLEDGRRRSLYKLVSARSGVLCTSKYAGYLRIDDSKVVKWLEVISYANAIHWPP